MINEFRVDSYILHNIQTALRNVIQEIFCEGGTDEQNEYKMNARKLMHGIYNIQNCIPSETLKELCKEACTKLAVNKPFKFLIVPILTRWWSVGVCSIMLDNGWKIW